MPLPALDLGCVNDFKRGRFPSSCSWHSGHIMDMRKGAKKYPTIQIHSRTRSTYGKKKIKVNKCKVMFIATRSLEPLLSLIYINGFEKLTTNWLSLLTTQNWGSGHGEERKKASKETLQSLALLGNLDKVLQITLNVDKCKSNTIYLQDLRTKWE